MKINKMTIGYIFLSLILVYFIILTVIYFAQRSLMYHPSENNYLDENKLNHKIEKIKIPSDNELTSWYFKKNESFKTLLFFHGNAGSLDNRIYKLNDLSKLNLNIRFEQVEQENNSPMINSPQRIVSRAKNLNIVINAELK